MSAYDDPVAHIRALEAEVESLRAQKAELMTALATSNETLRRAEAAMRGDVDPRPRLRAVLPDERNHQ